MKIFLGYPNLKKNIVKISQIFQIIDIVQFFIDKIMLIGLDRWFWRQIIFCSQAIMQKNVPPNWGINRKILIIF
jgi:hypothetical protein